jgi:aminopeptidase-like protein
MIGKEIHNLAQALWPINRSLTGPGVRQTLSVLSQELHGLTINEVPTGTQAFDWTVPREWLTREAYIITPEGTRICDFKTNNLHLVGYSIPVNKKLKLEELQNHLHSIPEQPHAIPYITSYYKDRWGFCIPHQDRVKLTPGEYEVLIDTELFAGSLSYGELIIPGATKQEIFLSTYVCHPSMANNELSGPCVSTFLAKKLQLLSNRRYTYRFVFIPETIGSIVYLSKNLKHLRENVVAGFNISCVGDNRDYSYLPSRAGNTLSDLVAQHVLKHIAQDFKSYKWSDRGSDERQYCSPGVDLPIASIMRTKYGHYPEYHTSLDDLKTVVTPEGLEGGYNALWHAIEAIERNVYTKVETLCEPQLGKRGLYPTLSTKSSGKDVRTMMDLLTWSDGRKSLLEIADLCGVPIWELYPLMDKLTENGLMTIHNAPL